MEEDDNDDDFRFGDGPKHGPIEAAVFDLLTPLDESAATLKAINAELRRIAGLLLWILLFTGLTAVVLILK